MPSKIRIGIVVGLIILIIAIGTFYFNDGKFNCNKSNADVTVMLFGADSVPNVLVQKINDELSPILKDVNNDGVKNIDFIVSQNSPMLDSAKMYADEAQVLILNFHDFMYYSKGDALLAIDDTVEKSSFNIDLNPQVKMSTNHDNTEHIYGIPLAGNKIFKDLGLDMKDMYIAVNGASNGSKMKDNALNIIEAILQY